MTPALQDGERAELTRRQNKPTPQQVRQLLADVQDTIGSYGDGDLLAIKHSADVLSHAIKLERDAQAARIVDIVCNLQAA